MSRERIGNHGGWPKAVLFRSIRRNRRVCCDCGSDIRSRGSFYILSPGPGKYLCFACERKMCAERDLEPKRAVGPAVPTPYTPVVVPAFEDLMKDGERDFA